jgi:hypothetical protein
MDALREHLRASEGARQAVIDYVNQSGHFSDNRPFSSAAEAVECAIGAGIRLMVNREGELEPSTSFSGDFIDHDSGGGWTMRRTWQRFQSSCHRPEWEAGNHQHHSPARSCSRRLWLDRTGKERGTSGP